MADQVETFFDAGELLAGDVETAFPGYPDLRDKRVFVTGGGSGIGAYFVAAFAAQGAEVAFVSLREGPAQKLCDGIERWCGNRPHFASCDIRHVNALQRAIGNFSDQLGGIDVLVNNAARDTRHDVTSYNQEQWDDTINTNLRPHFFSIQSVVESMRRAGGGSVINVGSNSANLGLAGYPAYVASKAGIVGLTRALARELGPDNIRVNALIPGWVMTERQKRLWVTPEALQDCLAQQSIKRAVNGEQVAQAALFLASSASAMITGQQLIVDGGRV